VFRNATIAVDQRRLDEPGRFTALVGAARQRVESK